MAHQVPDWEGVPPPATSSKPSFFTKQTLFTTSPAAAATKETPTALSTNTHRPNFRERLDRIVPPHRTYFGRSRRTFLLALLIAFLCLLALILGLAIGLSRKKSSAALPLPSNTSTFTGDLTYYGTGLGSCGITSSDDQLICAVSMILYDAASTSSNPNANPLCGRKIRITHLDLRDNTNKSIDVTVVDRCVGCKPEDLDLSPTGFDMLADMALGRVPGTWAWLPDGS